MTSSRTASRLNRILSMLPRVIANPGASVDEVTDRFGYTVKELTEDLNTILVCGLPGYGPGDLMDAYIDDDEVVVDVADYFAASPRLTAAEAITLLAAGMAMLSAGLASEALERGVAKLQRTLLGSAAAAVAIDVPADPEYVGLIRDAIRKRVAVAITYTGIASDRTTTRQVEPWEVFSSLGNWYLRGHCRLAGGERVFRLDRVRDLEVTESEATERVPAETGGALYSPGEDDVHVVLRLEPAARWVAEYYPVEVLSDDADGMTVRFSAGSALVAARLLLRLGPDAELVSGEEVASEVAALRDRIVTSYGASPNELTGQ